MNSLSKCVRTSNVLEVDPQLKANLVKNLWSLLCCSPEEYLEHSETCIQWISDVNAAYAGQERHGAQSLDIVNLKLSTIFWRAKIQAALLTSPPPWARSNPDELLDALLLTRAGLIEDQWEQAAALLTGHGLARLQAAHGIANAKYPDLGDLCGPGVNLDIVANRGSSTPWEKWREDRRFSQYLFEGDGVRFRGVCFRPGDVLLANVNLDGNGVYTALSAPRGFSSHCAFFAVLEHDGRRIPAVIETYEKGVRPVPLSVFLGDKFTSYVEVYRHHDYSEEKARALNAAAAEMINSVLGYNFDTEDPNPEYMSCTSVGRFLHQAAGLSPARTISALEDPQVLVNLAGLGYHFNEYFGPVDYLLNEAFSYVGFVDNQQLDRMLVREVADRAFYQQFSSNELESSRLPFPTAINRWGISHMRRQTLLGRLIGKLEGFTAETLPKGPDDLLAAIVPIEKQLGKIINKLRAPVNGELAKVTQLDVDTFMTRPAITAAVRKYFHLTWLSKPAAALEAVRQTV